MQLLDMDQALKEQSWHSVYVTCMGWNDNNFDILGQIEMSEVAAKRHG